MYRQPSLSRVRVLNIMWSFLLSTSSKWSQFYSQLALFPGSAPPKPIQDFKTKRTPFCFGNPLSHLFEDNKFVNSCFNPELVGTYFDDNISQKANDLFKPNCISLFLVCLVLLDVFGLVVVVGHMVVVGLVGVGVFKVKISVKQYFPLWDF